MLMYSLSSRSALSSLLLKRSVLGLLRHLDKGVRFVNPLHKNAIILPTTGPNYALCYVHRSSDCVTDPPSKKGKDTGG
ncbi:hypothetical protein F4814DRAFT_403728 [Daldinia grandis]|nr:hypothetical protein F4814DRAFT_403728 [Daldinia grandis]